MGESGASWHSRLAHTVRTLNDDYIDPFFDAVIDATEEAVFNAMPAAETMTGRDGVTPTRCQSSS